MQLESSEFVEELRKVFDLNQYEASALYALIVNKVSNAANINKLANIPKSRVYDVLESLVKKGFITVIGTRPLKYKINDFDDIILNIKENYKKEYEEKLARVDKALKSPIFEKVREMLSQQVETKDELAPKVYDGPSSMLKINKVLRESKHVVLVSLYSQFNKKINKIKKALNMAKAKGADIDIFLYKDTDEDIADKHKQLDMEIGNYIIANKKDIFLLDKEGDRVVHLSDPYLASRYIEIANTHIKK